MSTAKFNTWLSPDGTENYKCRAWVNFNGTGTVAIRASGNVASITDNGTGDYTVNFTTAMPDANYSTVGTCSGEDSFATNIFQAPAKGTPPYSSDATTTTIRCIVFAAGAGLIDGTKINVAIFR